MSAVNVTLKSPVSGLKVWFTYRPLTVCGERGEGGEERGEEKRRSGKGGEERGRKSFKNHRPSLYIEAT